MNLDPKIVAAALAAVEMVMLEIKGAKAAVVSTEDGFDVASRCQNTGETARLSAMASSMAALANIAGEESQIGASASVLIEASQGHIAMVQARRPDVSLVLSIVMGSDAITGQALYFSKKAARALEAA
jgi:predicted regulator of Ras-like GTPase activity (Roadblock/LC7/MglB family)